MRLRILMQNQVIKSWMTKFLCFNQFCPFLIKNTSILIRYVQWCIWEVFWSFFQWVVIIKKRIQLMKPVRSSTHIDIFEGKHFNFFRKGVKKSFFFAKRVKFASEYLLIVFFWLFLEKKSHFWGPLSHPDVSFKYPYDYI